MLLIALVAEEVDEAVDCIIHLWYSAPVRESDIDILECRFRLLIEDVCKKVKDNTSGSLLGKTWIFGQRSLRVVLENSSWVHLLSLVNKPAGLTVEQAHKIRATIALAEVEERLSRSICVACRLSSKSLLTSFGKMASCNPSQSNRVSGRQIADKPRESFQGTESLVLDRVQTRLGETVFGI